MKNVELFIEEYKKLEEAVRRVHGVGKNTSIVSVLKEDSRYSRFKDNIQSCADLRNFYQHDSKLNNRYLADVSDDAIRFVRQLTEYVNNRERCKNSCVNIKNVYWRTMNDSVKLTMQTMRDKLYTHVPILENGRVVGVFDENSLFSFISSSEDDIFEFDNNLSFNDLREYIQLDNREMEEFKFFGMNRYLDDAAEEFNKSIKQSKRLGLLLLTVNGKPSEELLGILTPWDLFKKH